jgi:hypothetical protein
VQATLAILDGGERVVAESSHDIPPTATGRVDLNVPLSSLPEGSYTLRLTASAGGSRAEQAAGFVVVR